MGEALIIAGMLAVIVDAPLKKRLLQESARGLFVHMLGYDLPPEIRTRLSQIVFGTSVYIPHKYLRCAISKLSDEWVSVKVEETYTVHNPTKTVQNYTHEILFEWGEYPYEAKISMLSDDDEYSETSIECAGDNEGFLKVGPRLVKIPAESSRDFIRKYSMIRPVGGWQELFQATPVMKVSIILDYNENELSATVGSFKNPGKQEFVLNKLFMVGEHIGVRWRPASWQIGPAVPQYGPSNLPPSRV
jgi:hypothetical protein